jgi:hypothetical protein
MIQILAACGASPAFEDFDTSRRSVYSHGERICSIRLKVSVTKGVILRDYQAVTTLRPPIPGETKGTARFFTTTYEVAAVTDAEANLFTTAQEVAIIRGSSLLPEVREVTLTAIRAHMAGQLMTTLILPVTYVQYPSLRRMLEPAFLMLAANGDRDETERAALLARRYTAVAPHPLKISGITFEVSKRAIVYNFPPTIDLANNLTGLLVTGFRSPDTAKDDFLAATSTDPAQIAVTIQGERGGIPYLAVVLAYGDSDDIARRNTSPLRVTPIVCLPGAEEVAYYSLAPRPSPARSEVPPPPRTSPPRDRYESKVWSPTVPRTAPARVSAQRSDDMDAKDDADSNDLEQFMERHLRHLLRESLPTMEAEIRRRVRRDEGQRSAAEPRRSDRAPDGRARIDPPPPHVNDRYNQC